MEPLIECIPNFSEGRNIDTLNAITDVLDNSEGVMLLHRDVGHAANRTVFTFSGAPEAVFNAAFEAMKVAGERIDMSFQQGTHPRIGATDVCPFVPIRGITLDELVPMVHAFGKRIGDELGINGYFYEATAINPKNKSLAIARKGRYEGLPARIKEEKPDFGPAEFNPKQGATLIAARDYLVAFNINLDTRSAEIAHKIACEVRESGFWTEENGERVKHPGKLKHLRSLGWFIEEYGIAQVSCNLINFRETGMHTVYETVKEVASRYKVKVTGSELIGMSPAKALIDAGLHYTNDANRTTDELIQAAVEAMNLDELHEFDIVDRVIEIAIRNRQLIG